jgi:magnesium-transporting ATPase (P-type)
LGRFLNFKIEPDPFAWIFILVGVSLGVLIYVFFTWWRMEDGLRSRRSPNQVRLEAAAAGIVLGAALPCLLAAWGFGWFLVFLLIAVFVAFWGKSSWLGWLILALGLLIAISAVFLKLTPSNDKTDSGAPYHATPPVQGESGGVYGSSAAAESESGAAYRATPPVHARSDDPRPPAETK